MATRIRIPLLLDVVVIDDRGEMKELNGQPAIARELSGRGGLLHRLLRGRIRPTMTVRTATGTDQPLPAFQGREDRERAGAQRALDARLTGLAKSPSPSAGGTAEIARLGQYVAGLRHEAPVGVTVQQAIGRLFDGSYVATRESYRAARIINAWTTADPIRAFWWKATGRLARSRALVWTLAKNDPQLIHSTAFAVHSVVGALKRMRRTVKTEGLWHRHASEAAARALVAPRALLRESREVLSVSFLRRPLRPGTLIVFRLRKIHAGTGENELAFSRGEWSQCPAHDIVPCLLQSAWDAAVRELAYRRGQPIRPFRAYRLLSVPLRWALAPLVWPAGWLVIAVFRRINRRVPWYRLPRFLAFANLAVLRIVLRRENLHDTTMLPTQPAPGTHELSPAGPDVLRWRTADGSYNDLRDPEMGRAGTRFGRNVPLAHTYPESLPALLEPSPRLVAEQLLARKTFVPAPSLNVLAAAWIQFQVHDWFAHGDNEHLDPFLLELDARDPWPGPRPMQIARTRRDPSRPYPPESGPPTYANTVTHWWDASQLYGSDLATQRRVRSGQHGKLALEPDGRLRVDPHQIDISGFTENWWLGLSLLHHVFTFEHNAVCDRLRSEYKAWDDEQIFQTARLIIAALIAKIHELDWVPVVLAHPTVQTGLRANWWGLGGEWVRRHIGRLGDGEMISGIPGSPADHHAAPYAITEEFVSVYRMHAFFLRDEFPFFSVGGEHLGTHTLGQVVGGGARAMLDKYPMPDLLYSLGIEVPGALSLGNYPALLRDLALPGGQHVDLATIDILRDRERGVPRYNDFRELLHLPRITSFEELNLAWADALRAVYKGDVDRIDLRVGLLAEAPPSGFGFGDTTFRIFVLMNSRRLKSDRFFTDDYTPAVYTQIGMDWINDNDMRSVLIRHFPALEPALAGAGNVFAPWKRMTAAR